MIEELLRFLGIDDDTKQHGRDLWELVAPRVDAIIEAFYQRVQSTHVSSHVTDEAIQRLKLRQKEHWVALFSSNFDEAYANSVRRIGIRHRDIDLNPMWYIAGYMALKIEFVNVIAESRIPLARKGRLMKTLDKYTALDMALAMSTYDAAIFD